jgi:hypothetical protein
MRRPSLIQITSRRIFRPESGLLRRRRGFLPKIRHPRLLLLALAGSLLDGS